MIFLIIALAVLATTLLIVKLINAKYEKFVFEHSVMINKVKEINLKYDFALVEKFNLVNSYDNENFYSDISPRDYFIYWLVDEEKRVQNAMISAAKNESLLPKYSEEIKSDFVLNVYDTKKLLKNKKKLIKTEKKVLSRIIYRPVTSVSVNVLLWLTNINGRRKSYKKDVFYTTEIESILNEMHKKSGKHYTESIWKSICRVERGKVSNKLRFAIYKRDNYRCKKCGSHRNLEVDHIFPISKGGKSNINNLRTLCHECNSRKSNHLPKAKETNKMCPVCGQKLVLKVGKYGQFYGCSSYPQCKYIQNFNQRGKK